MTLALIFSAAAQRGIPLTPFQTMLVIGGAAGFLAILLAAFMIHDHFYRRYGYPSVPRWRSRISLSDKLDVVWKKLQPALQEGFEVQSRNDQSIIVQKTYADPPCVMTMEYVRSGHLSWQKLSVVCVGRKWLNWTTTSGGNRWKIGPRWVFHRAATADPLLPENTPPKES